MSPSGRARRSSATGLSLLDGLGGGGSDDDAAGADAWSQSNVEADVAAAGELRSDDEAVGEEGGDAGSVHDDMFAVDLELEAEVKDLRRQVQRQAGLLKEKRAVVRKAVQSSSQLRAVRIMCSWCTNGHTADQLLRCALAEARNSQRPH